MTDLPTNRKAGLTKQQLMQQKLKEQLARTTMKQQKKL